MTRRVALLFGAFAPFLAAQGNRASPHETVSLDLKSDKITISYGRPYLKGRKLEQIEAYGQVWRLGADEATKITVSGKTRIGDLEVEPGSYALFAIAGADKWTIIVNKTADQWGAFSYKQSDDMGRFEAPLKHASSPVEQFTITLNKDSDTTGTLTFAWGDTSVSTMVKAE
jgi:hypothetical protein